ncbi:MAG: CCA tRNA nucleotidyltransferase, partial [Nitrospirae bacterium]|nr:CCA tRNA nucleotidyltransferase [Nitrospirota bacterium]
MDLANKILSDPINQWLFNHARKDIYLVGGYIRDLLHGGDISKDKDYILKHNARKIALITSNKFKGTFIELKKDRMFRVALNDGQFLDFSQMQNNVLKDLSKRDFRINAIAWSPVKGLIDPFDGRTDLKNKIIRMISPENLSEDPLRLLRAYRLAAQLGFTIERDTRNYLRKYSSKIKKTASERITQELFKLLMTENASYYIALCEKDKVLHKILNVTNAKI